jgi:hypothetical protein
MDKYELNVEGLSEVRWPGKVVLRNDVKRLTKWSVIVTD